MATDYQQYWLRRARLVASRHAVARWLEIFLPGAAAVCGAGAVALLIMRGMEARLEPAYIVIGIAVALAAIAAGWFAQSRVLTLEQALVRLEDEGHLHTRLSAAREGVGAWPSPAEVRDPARWNWQRLAAPVLVAVGLLIGARLVPLPEDAFRRPPREQPIAFSQVETWLQNLEEAKTVDPEALEKLAQRLEELRNQPPEKWYTQSSLEAGDSLRQQTESALRSMQRDLEQAQQIAGETRRSGDQKSGDQLKKMDEQWQQALQSLGSGDLPLSKELLQQAKNFQPSQSKQLSQQQIDDLKKRLEEGQKVTEKCVGPCQNKRPGEEEGDGVGDGDGDPQKGAPGGRGGGETAPLSLKKKEVNLASKEKEKIENEDLSRALPGETLGVTTGEHEVDKAALNPQAGGAITSTGEGGAAVWRESLVPREREVLQRFFR